MIATYCLTASEWLLLHPVKRKHPSKDGCFSFALYQRMYFPANRYAFGRKRVAVANLYFKFQHYKNKSLYLI